MTKYNLNHSEAGFTLVELIVSITITAIIMVGVSAFFASSFHNIFVTQEELDESQGQFATNEIVRSKLSGVEEIIDNNTTDIVVRNNTDNGDLPFTYIGDDGGKLVFKDFFVFNGMYEDKVSTGHGITNPGGITKTDANDYYITAPLENAIYECDSSIANCTIWLNSGLDHPTDITTDGTDLYVSNSGNDRVVKIIESTKAITEFPFELNFPTGVAYDNVNGELFVSDTYNNRVVRIYDSGSKMSVIAGEGESDTCDNSAKLCKLDFPTGLAIDTSTNKSLFISDTGSGRILKITDPIAGIDLSSQEINFNIPSVQKISKIDFTFPVGTISSAIIVTTNPIHPGIWGDSGSKLSLYLAVPLVKGDANLQCCTPACVTGDDPCPIHFRRFTVNTINNIFESENDISIGTEETGEYVVDGAPSTITGGYSVNVNPPGGPDDRNEISYPPGTMVTIDSNYDGDKVFDFDLSGSSISSGFNLVTTEIYDESDTITVTETQILRIGDGTIGTAEDTIEVVVDALDYPTGLSSGIEYTDEADYDTGNFPDFDYESSFGLNDLQFSQPNSNILQMDIETTNGDEYIINAALN